MNSDPLAHESESAGVPVGTLVASRYRVEAVLGRGGMCVVVEAEDVAAHGRVALKVLRDEVAKSREAVQRFLREARAVETIRSEHVAGVSEVGALDSGQPYMVMERLVGADLRSVLDERKRLPLDEAAEYLLQALEAVAAAHAAGIVHRDLKPSNLFVTRRPDGSPFVKVLDFGISKITTGMPVPADPLTHTSALLGSPLYMSPEQMKAARNIDGRSDLWSLGVIFYELLVGHTPFRGDSLTEVCAQIVLDGEVPSARRAVPELPAAVDEVIGRCLERDLTRRCADAAELARALAQFAPARAQASVERIAAALAAAESAASERASGAEVTPASSTAPPSAPSSVSATTSVNAPPSVREPERSVPKLALVAALLALVAGLVALALGRAKPSSGATDAAISHGNEATEPAGAKAAPPRPAAASPPAPSETLPAASAESPARVTASASTSSTRAPARAPARRGAATTFGGRR